MSLEAHKAVLYSPPQRRMSDRLVLVVIANEAAADGANARPGMDYLSTLSGVSRRTIPTAIERLEEDLWVWVHRRGNGRASHYVLTLPGLADLAPRRWSCRECLLAAKAYRQHLEHAADHPAYDLDAPLPTPVDSHPNQCNRCTGRAATEPVQSRPETSATTSAIEPPNQCNSSALDPDPETRTRDAGEAGAPPVDNRPPSARLADALVAACHPRADGIEQLTRTEAGRVRSAAADLAEVDATPDQVAEVARRYSREWNTELTATAIAANWHRFAAPKDQGPARSPAAVTASNLAGVPWPDVAALLDSQGHPPDQVTAARAAWATARQAS